MNISPISNNLGFGKLHIVKSSKTEKMLKEVARCPEDFAAAKEAFSAINETSGDTDVFLKVVGSGENDTYVVISLNENDKLAEDEHPFTMEGFHPNFGLRKSQFELIQEKFTDTFTRYKKETEVNEAIKEIFETYA